METKYTSEKNTTILMALMKKHGISKVIASPGTTNIRLVASMQSDPYFEMYSAADERSAAYMACGMAAESGQPVALSCTGATASRNYIPGLTEAYYRHLPVLAITSTQHWSRVGNMVPQVIDRTAQLNDMVNYSIEVPMLNEKDSHDESGCVTEINRALIELRRNGGGPVHINLATSYSQDFSVKELPNPRKVDYYTYSDKLPTITHKKIAIQVGAHLAWTDELIESVEQFCGSYNAVVLGDHTSGYKGKYFIMGNLICDQDRYSYEFTKVDLLIHIGEISGAYMSVPCTTVWRVSPDGEAKDAGRNLEAVFQMKEADFFHTYAALNETDGFQTSYMSEWKGEYESLSGLIPELPFSNIWIAKQIAPLLPKDAVIHFGILSSLRSFNFFETDPSVRGYCNTGGFGIDGGVSSFVGASLVYPDKLYFGVFGDLAFFYDMNVLGNRHVGTNIRILLINNGQGGEFRNYSHPGAQFGEDAAQFISAAGHYGNQSPVLVKHYAEDLGFEYLTADSKDSFLAAVDRFTAPEITDKPILFEVFTDVKAESDALKMIHTLKTDTSKNVKGWVKDILGPQGVENVRKIKNKVKS